MLHDFLLEILFLFEVKNLGFKNFNVVITENSEHILSAELFGEKYSQEKHGRVCEIKAVTYPGLFVGEKEGKWIAEVLCDI